MPRFTPRSCSWAVSFSGLMTPAMPRHRPTNRLSECTPQWLALLIEMRLVTPKQAHEAHVRAEKQAEQESGAAADQPPPRRRRRKPD